MKQPLRLSLLLVVLALSACGGGGGSSGNASSGANINTSVNHYTVGGSVSGLTALSGLVLLDNGGDALTVTANATSFNFATPITAGGAYAVTVKTQPSGMTCTVGDGTGTATADVSSVNVACTSNFATGANNVVPVVVNKGPGANPSFDMPYTSVQVCQGSTCVTVNDVLVDTASSGLRLMASALATASPGLTPTPMSDPNNVNNTIAECLPFADGSLWGSVSTLTVKIGGEQSASAIPVQIIDDNGAAPPAPTSGCNNILVNDSKGTIIDKIGANGILGVSVANQDCGSACVGAAYAGNNVYWSCTGGGSSTCTSTALDASDQVANPAASFTSTGDDNGVIVQLPALPPGGAATASGYLAFGVGTEPNNALGSQTILTASTTLGAFGQITTTYAGENLPNSFIDSGSNGLYFTDNSLTSCSDAPDFYCPSETQSLSAVNQGQNGNTTTVDFQVANLDQLDPSHYALDDVGGTAPAISSWKYFDWGAPFFFGRTIYLVIQNQTVGSTTGPFYAY